MQVQNQVSDFLLKFRFLAGNIMEQSESTMIFRFMNNVNEIAESKDRAILEGTAF